MDKFFTQQELFWLDDILPGVKLGRIRRLSATRTVHIPKSNEPSNNPSATVNLISFSFQLFIISHRIIDNNNSFSATYR